MTSIFQRKHLIAAVALAIFGFGLINSIQAHNIKGVANPTLATARITSPTTATDLPIPIFDTGISVACFKARNTSPYEAIISAIGFDLPGTFTSDSDFVLVSPTNSIFRAENEIDYVPGFPAVTLDFAVLTGRRFSSVGKHGIYPSTAFTTICVSGTFPPNSTIENLLDYVYVRFQNVGPNGNLSDVGVWENRPPTSNRENLSEDTANDFIAKQLK